MPADRQEPFEWLLDVERAIPTVVLELVDETGAPRSDVSVTVDGKPLVERLDGQAVHVDPGEHTFVFTPRGGRSIERRMTVAEGARRVKVAVSLEPPTPAPRPAPQPSGDEPPSGPHPLPLVLGGLSLVGFGLFAGFGISALVTGGKCKPSCTDEQKDDVVVRAAVADAGLALGVLALGGSLISLFVLDSGDEGDARLEIGPTLGGAAIRGRF